MKHKVGSEMSMRSDGIELGSMWMSGWFKVGFMGGAAMQVRG
ncbi:MAG: hypothetical protein Q4D78_09885 [Neisseria zoodegmatis]|nr:hypothetical protein [Neisseria zoodegmatis]MDO5070478.1 hypothetical protein [Neisseria zoodegmatis]